MRRLDSIEDLNRAAKALVDGHAEFGPVLNLVGPLRLRRREGGFSGLLYIILAQQVSTASARALWQRTVDGGFDQPSGLLRAGDAELRQAGFSRQKIAYARALAQAGIDYEALAGMEDDDLIARLMALKGIGRWSAEIYAKFSLGRPDIFAAGDLALQEAVRALHDLPARPDEDQTRAIAAAWSPHRTVAATILWQYYAHLKSREGVI